jgi:hypothetical protein
VRLQFQRSIEDWSMRIKWQDYIEERQEVMLRKPLFKGTQSRSMPLPPVVDSTAAMAASVPRTT